jgi:transcriptional regulator with XRE-family HTH domain
MTTGHTVKRLISTRLDLPAIGRRIRTIRGFDLTQQQFGEILGISQALLSKYESGDRLPSLAVLLRLKKHSGRTIDWIITGTDGEIDRRE